ncbi:MAG: CDP-glycerol glycerophosphotransferase family protein [Chitinivibrionales bacterium]|nr:CDP-glycerol glycerophosphotransferase family protein [Chitinivibrionales bacterium]
MNDQKIRVLFEIVQEYYWPAMEPIYKVLAADQRYELSLKIGPNHRRFLGFLLVSQKKNIEKKYRKQGFTITNSVTGYDAVICGDTLPKPSQYGNAILCNVDHGPCFKSLRYRNLLKQPSAQYVVFAEGTYRMKKLSQHHLDTRHIIRDVGLPKLDPFFTGAYSREMIINRHNLDPRKKIVLYAPTYKPTSIFQVSQTIATLLDQYSVIVKLHPYSWSGKYAPHRQHRIFERLAQTYPNLCLVSPTIHDIMPYLFAADTMISEASSVINEFLALERCGIIFDLNDATLKHSDGQPLLEERTSDWLKESFVHINQPQQLKSAVDEALNPSPQRRVNLKRDKEYIYSYTDGSSSRRVKQAIEELIIKKHDAASIV